jgi:class 3 adenylate cyclase
VWFDPRGTGASDRIHHEEGRLIESVVDDMIAVLDAVGCERAALLGLGVPIPLLFAATHPDRTEALVLADATARVRSAEDYPIGLPDDLIVEHTHNAQLGGVSVQDRIVPGGMDDPEFGRWFRHAERLTAPPAERESRVRDTFATDLRAALSTIRVPTMVINHLDRGRDGKPARQTRYVVEHIDNAISIEVPGADYMPFAQDSVALVDSIEEFLTGRLPSTDFDRVLATILFTDIVNSTSQAARLGDRRWRELLDRHDTLANREIQRFRGTRVKSTGDGVLATFDGPARAIRCAIAIRDSLRPVGLEVRAGLHAGEIELVGHDIAGIAVHTAQRIESLAATGEVLVSRTVADLLAGSGIKFADRGEHQLKGVPGTWRVFSVPG